MLVRMKGNVRAYNLDIWGLRVASKLFSAFGREMENYRL